MNAQTGELIGAYVWGLDLSGTFQGAGGIGGLLWVNVESGSHAGRYFVAYDGNGNVMGLVSASDGSVVAQYEYGPFAEPLRATGPLAADNPFRFSTKYTDSEAALIYYGYRYYSPSLGRWLSRDRIQEKAHLNLYSIAKNCAINFIDFMGLQIASSITNTPVWIDPVKYFRSEPLYGIRAFDKLLREFQNCQVAEKAGLLDALKELRSMFFNISLVTTKPSLLRSGSCAEYAPWEHWLRLRGVIRSQKTPLMN